MHKMVWTLLIKFTRHIDTYKYNKNEVIQEFSIVPFLVLPNKMEMVRGK